MTNKRPPGAAGKPATPPRHMSLAAAASALDVSPATVRRRIDAGTIKAVRLDNGNRIPLRSSVERLARRGGK